MKMSRCDAKTGKYEYTLAYSSFFVTLFMFFFYRNMRLECKELLLQCGIKPVATCTEDLPLDDQIENCLRCFQGLQEKKPGLWNNVETRRMYELAMMTIGHVTGTMRERIVQRVRI